MTNTNKATETMTKGEMTAEYFAVGETWGIVKSRHGALQHKSWRLDITPVGAVALVSLSGPRTRLFRSIPEALSYAVSA